MQREIMGQTQAKPTPVKVKKAVTNNPPPPPAEERLNPQDFILQGIEGQTVLREPGKIKGQQFILDGCKGCDIYLLDHLAQVTIDECVDCRIVMGPCESSVFIRDCKNCVFVLAVQQLRTRDCHNIDLLLFSKTRPIIESSTQVRFGSFSYSYFNLREQFDKAGLSIWDNRWSEVYDFTPAGGGGGPNSTNVGLDVNHNTLGVKPLDADVAGRVGYTEEASMQSVPRTVGVTNRPNNGSSWLVVLAGEEAVSQGMEVVQALLLTNSGVALVQTRTTKLDKSQVEELFGKGNKAAGKALPGKARVLGMEVVAQGEAVVKEALQKIFPTASNEEIRYCVRGQDTTALFFTNWRVEDS